MSKYDDDNEDMFINIKVSKAVVRAHEIAHARMSETELKSHYKDWVRLVGAA
jgi:hypothetical protein